MSSTRTLFLIGSLLASTTAIQQQEQKNLRSSVVTSSSDRQLKSAAQKAAKEAAGTHYYEIKAKTTKAVPDNGLNSVTTDAVEEGQAEVVEVSLDTDFEKKEDKRESRKADKKAREEAESTGASVHTWNGETRRGLAGSPTKSPSSGLHKPTWKPSSKPNEHRALEQADPCHDGLSPRCTPPTNKPVEHRSLAGSPTKSPSSGLHKPTWKPSSKPNEHRKLSSKSKGKDSRPTMTPRTDKPSDRVTRRQLEENPSQSSRQLNGFLNLLDRIPFFGKKASDNKQPLPNAVNEVPPPPPAAMAPIAPVDTFPVAPVNTVPEGVKSVTASDVKFPVEEERTGLAPDHKDSEPMYPTVVNIPFVEANNPNGPQSEGPLTKEDKVVTKVVTDKVVKIPTPPKVTDKIVTENVIADTTTNKPYVKIIARDSTSSSATKSSLKKASYTPSTTTSTGNIMSAAKPLMSSSAKTTTKNGGTPSKSPSSGLHKPTWKPSQKPHEKSSGKSKKMEEEDADNVAYAYGAGGSFTNDDFRAPLPATKLIVVKQMVRGIGKRAGNWKEKFENGFVAATAKVLGISKHGITITNMDRVDDDTQDDDSKFDDNKKDKKTSEIDYTGGNGWLLEVTYVCYDFDGGELSVKDVYVNLGKKANQASVQASLALAEIGKGNEPKLGSYTVNAMKSTEQPTGAPIKHPKSPTKQPVASPTPEPTLSPTVYLEPGSKAMLLKIQVTGITKRARDWKQNLEDALKPVVAKALDINDKFLTFNNNQRRYTDGEIWVDFTVPNDDFDFKEEGATKKLTDPDIQHLMTVALKKSGLGKGNDPGVGGVEAIIFKATPAPSMKPTHAPVHEWDDDDDGNDDDNHHHPKNDDDSTSGDDSTDTDDSTDMPAVVATQSISGISAADATEPEFQTALMEAVAEELGDDDADISITSTKPNDDGSIAVQYAITGLGSKKQKKALKAVESSSMASAIQDSLKDEGYKKADVSEADADVVTVTTESAVVATQSFSGVTEEQASEPAFENALEATVAEELGVDADDVVITSTAASDDGKSVVIVYTVTNIPSSKQKKAKQTLQLATTSSAIEKSLKSEGYTKVDVDYADTEISTVTVVPDSGNDDNSGNDDKSGDDNTINDDMTDMPALVATQSFTGVTVADVSEPTFQTALEAAVADELSVDADDITITSISAGYNGNVVVEYAVVGVPAKKQKKAKQTLESSSTASAIEDSLKDEGYKKVDVDEAEAEVTTVSTESAVVATQDFTGVTVEEASEPAFETALETAVADELGVDADDVAITSTTANDDGSVSVQYTVTSIPAKKQKKAKQTLESSSTASAIEGSLQDGGYKKVDVSEADADVTTVVVVADTGSDDKSGDDKASDDNTNNDDVPDVNGPAVVAVQSFSGVTLAEASDPAFETAVETAVADELGVDANDVIITSTTASQDGKSIEIQYAVAGISTKKQKKAKETLESKSTASAIEDSLKEEGYKKVDVDEAEADIGTVETAPAVVADQTFSGITLEEASQPAFEMALEVAVAEKLGVESGDVTITSTSTNNDGSVVVEYAVTGISSTKKQKKALKSVESSSMASAIQEGLKEEGYKKVDVADAEADITNVVTVVSSNTDDKTDDAKGNDDVVIYTPSNDDVISPLPKSIQVVQSFNGVSYSEAKTYEFQNAVKETVSTVLGVNPLDVEVTAVEMDGGLTAKVTYTVIDNYDFSKSNMKTELESKNKEIEAELKNRGYVADAGTMTTSNVGGEVKVEYTNSKSSKKSSSKKSSSKKSAKRSLRGVKAI